jgi:fused signal recognition particle receptor
MFENLKKKLSSLFSSKEKPEKKGKIAPKKQKEKLSKALKKSSKSAKIKEEQIDKTLKKESEKIPKEKEIHLEPDAVKQFENLKQQSIEEQIESLPIPKPEKTEEKSSGFFSKLKKAITTSVLKQSEFDKIFQDLELSLLENNVSLSVVDKIRSQLSQDFVGLSIKRSEIKSLDSLILNSLKEAISSVLIEPPILIDQIKKSLSSPYVILFFGINGSGKTTSVAKLAYYLKKSGLSVCLAAADTFRAASIEQLSEHAQKLSVPIIKSQYGSDPASVAHKAISYAKKNKIQVVLIDTAGRMYTKKNLMKEMEKIVRVSSPQLKLFVGESITGNDATSQAEMFSQTAGIDGIILSKADIDEKAGTILSVSHVTKAPIYFLGTGQKYSDLQPFNKSTVLKHLGLE